MLKMHIKDSKGWCLQNSVAMFGQIRISFRAAEITTVIHIQL